mmetsp:Transcript_1226/g.3636  ORF Transcript_1226/g.3636 Transcript_1226/m.3636 type:complete len:201 (+) Transcript_1226:496-1098(+)
MAATAAVLVVVLMVANSDHIWNTGRSRLNSIHEAVPHILASVSVGDVSHMEDEIRPSLHISLCILHCALRPGGLSLAMVWVSHVPIGEELKALLAARGRRRLEGHDGPAVRHLVAIPRAGHQTGQHHVVEEVGVVLIVPGGTGTHIGRRIRLHVPLAMFQLVKQMRGRVDSGLSIVHCRRARRTLRLPAHPHLIRLPSHR